MKPTKEQVEAYKAMAAQAPQSMADIIRSHLEQNCQKFKGNEDTFERCIKHLYDTVLEMLGGRSSAKDGKLSGHVPAETCFRICMDYFNDEVWKAEDEEEKKAKSVKKKSDSVTAKCSVDDVDDDEPKSTEVPQAQKPNASVKKKQEEGQLDFFAMMGMK